ncbi:inner centromere protein-like [Crotalus adamanteus]|uniref:Inner centromere protein-like n=1 Tax=Crotalus adamanteus TaxID=8729 RepID=A0AAW1C6Y8_CROAD
MKIFDSNNFSTEPELMPKTPSQKKYRKKKRSSLFKDENKELIRKRLSKGHGSLKTESFQKVSPRRVLNSLNVRDAISLPDIMMNSSKGTSKVQSDRIAMGPVGEPLGSLSGHRRLSRPHKTPRISLVEKYSLSNKRKSTIRKSISRTIARKQAAQDSSSASSRVSCHSSTEIFLNDENHKDGPLTQNAELGEPLNSLQKEPCALDASSLIVSTPMHNPTQFERHQDKTCNKDRLETIITDSYISNSEDLARNNSSHEPMQNIRKQSYRQAVEDLPAPSCTEDKNPSPFSHTTTSTSAKKMLPTSGPSKIIQPFKNFFQIMQKNQLLKSPGSSGNKVPKHSTPCKSATKGEFVEKERQRLESLRKKQEAEQQRKQKVEEEKRRRLEEIKLKREERLRKALQARERVEQMEEEKKKRMEQKFSQLDERNDKV